MPASLVTSPLPSASWLRVNVRSPIRSTRRVPTSHLHETGCDGLRYSPVLAVDGVVRHRGLSADPGRDLVRGVRPRRRSLRRVPAAPGGAHLDLAHDRPVEGRRGGVRRHRAVRVPGVRCPTRAWCRRSGRTASGGVATSVVVPSANTVTLRGSLAMAVEAPMASASVASGEESIDGRHVGRRGGGRRGWCGCRRCRSARASPAWSARGSASGRRGGHEPRRRILLRPHDTGGDRGDHRGGRGETTTQPRRRPPSTFQSTPRRRRGSGPVRRRRPCRPRPRPAPSGPLGGRAHRWCPSTHLLGAQGAGQ